MQYLSVCSGIEAASVAWSPLGFEALAFAEVDKFPSAVLAHHYPQVPNLGDMTLASQWSDYEPNILVGGTPCQSFSVAGLRKGLADPRGNLMLTYLAIADRYQPEWIVWENVPGVLSSGSGRDFGTFLGALGQIGYGWAYRVLDAQFFGVPQRRRRVFVVGHLGDWRRAAAVLFERHSLQGHPPPSREKREGVASTITGGTDTGRNHGKRSGSDRDNLVTYACDGIGAFSSSSSSSPILQSGADLGHGCEALVGSWWDGGQTAQTLDAVLQKGQTMPEKNRFPAVLVPDTAHSLRAEGFDASEDGTGRGTPLVPLMFDQTARQPEWGFNRPMKTDGPPAVVTTAMQVRRLTPRECERLQGFPDDYTLIPFTHGKPAADGPRYKALGNSMAVPVMRWIGERIQLVDWLHAND